jgi:hypothetical protein
MQAVCELGQCSGSGQLDREDPVPARRPAERERRSRSAPPWGRRPHAREAGRGCDPRGRSRPSRAPRPPRGAWPRVDEQLHSFASRSSTTPKNCISLSVRRTAVSARESQAEAKAPSPRHLRRRCSLPQALATDARQAQPTIESECAGLRKLPSSSSRSTWVALPSPSWSRTLAGHRFGSPAPASS